MKKNFKQIAEQSMTLSRLHNGRDKVETSEIVDKPLTVEDFDLVVRDDGVQYAVLTFKELPGAYYNGGLIITKMVVAWVSEYDGNVDDAAADYAKAKDNERVKIQLAETKAASSNHNLTTVKLL